MGKKFVIAALILAGVYYYLRGEVTAVSVDIGVDFPLQLNRPLSTSSAPFQQLLNGDRRAYVFQEYRVLPLASFQLQARVLGVERYRYGREAALSPVDLALGWGPMADVTTLESIDISQSSRFYHWRVSEYPIPRRDIETNSANMHVIPANDDVKAALFDVKEGQVVQLHGYLVRIDADDGWRWRSSLTRKDTGYNACELVLAERLRIL